MTFPSLNIEKLRHDTIQKVKKEKQDKENAKKLQQKQYDYQNYLNLSHIKKSSSFKMIKDEYYDLDKLDKEFDNYLEYHNIYKFKQHIEDHTKLKSTDKSLVPSKLREEMKYLDPIIEHLKNQKR
jgi:hypothetical protein|tara:strand:- start:400 stop:774 length:375 start_codon:yes stop_codon:yes gene_type:complete